MAQVLVSKYADHLPLYRQAQICARQVIALDRSTLADWVGHAAFLLRPVHERLLMRLKGSAKLFADETMAPVLDPGRGRTKTGQLWAYARDDRPWAGLIRLASSMLCAGPQVGAADPSPGPLQGHSPGGRLRWLPCARRARRRAARLLLGPCAASNRRTTLPISSLGSSTSSQQPSRRSSAVGLPDSPGAQAVA